jgi:hypothetical protein
LELAGERPAADHALGARSGALTEPAVRGDEPVRPLEFRCLARDSVVSGLLALEDDDRAHALPLAPRVDELDELLARNVRPQRAADVLGVDEDGRDRLRRRLGGADRGYAGFAGVTCGFTQRAALRSRG